MITFWSSTNNSSIHSYLNHAWETFCRSFQFTFSLFCALCLLDLTWKTERVRKKDEIYRHWIHVPFASFLGGQISPEGISIAVGLTLVLGIPLSRIIGFRRIATTKRQIIFSTCVILFCMLAFAVFRITEGSLGHKLEYIPRLTFVVMTFIVMTFFNLVGISRNSMLIVQHVLTSYSLQLHLKTTSIAVTWIFIFIITKLLPRALFLVGDGYFFCYMAIIVLIALVFLYKCMPSSFNLDPEIIAKCAMETSIFSSISIETPSTNHLSESSSQNEIHHAENSEIV